jgi:hypothetical protein
MSYFHIPMHPDYQHFLYFCHEGRVYQFQALPFRQASAPLIFTTVIETFVAPFHALGLKLPFLPSRLVAPLLVLRDPQKAGLPAPTEGEDKSELDPSQDFVFVGVRFRTAEGLVSPPLDQIIKIRDLLRCRSSVTAREFLRLLLLSQ